MIAAVLASSLAIGAWAQPKSVGVLFQFSQRGEVGYVLASMHGRIPQEIALNDRVKEAIQWADAVAFETLVSGDVGAIRRILRPAPGDPPVEAVMGEGLAGRARHEIERRGGDETHWRRLMNVKVEFARETLGTIVGSLEASRAGSRSKHPGIDLLVQAEATRLGRRIETLESSERLFRTRFQLTQDQAIADLEAYVTRLEQDPEGLAGEAHATNLDKLLFAGELEAMYDDFRGRYCNGPNLKAVCDNMLEGRNPFLASRIDTLFASGRKVVAVVGALHVAGPRSILAELRDRGYTVRRITPKP